jgi:hypothetical protein
MMDVTRGAHGEVTIRVEGEFGPGEARRLVGWLSEVSATEPLVLDFAAARVTHDVGLATVAGPLTGRAQVTVHGLSRHQEKLLRYLGVDLRPPADVGQAAG